MSTHLANWRGGWVLSESLTVVARMDGRETLAKNATLSQSVYLRSPGTFAGLSRAPKQKILSKRYLASHCTGRLSNPRNAQPPIRTGSLLSSRRPFSRVNRLGSATSATMAREANAPAQ
jgi:hypothetical protein